MFLYFPYPKNNNNKLDQSNVTRTISESSGHKNKFRLL